MSPLFELSGENKHIFKKYLENNIGIIGVVFATIGFTNYLFAGKIVDKNLSLVILIIGGVLIVLHYVNHVLITNLE